MLRDGEISLMVVTSSGDAGRRAVTDARSAHLLAGLKVPLVTTIAGAKATAAAVGVLQEGSLIWLLSRTSSRRQERCKRVF